MLYMTICTMWPLIHVWPLRCFFIRSPFFCRKGFLGCGSGVGAGALKTAFVTSSEILSLKVFSNALRLFVSALILLALSMKKKNTNNHHNV